MAQKTVLAGRVLGRPFRPSRQNVTTGVLARGRPSVPAVALYRRRLPATVDVALATVRDGDAVVPDAEVRPPDGLPDGEDAEVGPSGPRVGPSATLDETLDMAGLPVAPRVEGVAGVPVAPWRPIKTAPVREGTLVEEGPPTLVALRVVVGKVDARPRVLAG